MAELRSMSEATAKTELSFQEFQTWESLNEKLDEHEDTLEDFEDAEEVTTDAIVFADRSDLATDISVMGNDIAVYYDPSDDEIRDPAERLQERFDIDDADGLDADDVPEEEIEFVETALVDLICAAIIEWDGTHWDDLSPGDADAIRHGIGDWGLAAMMDAWVEVQLAVEENRNERLERIEKFRDPERRGDRRSPAADRV
jgi:hypothetical protein